jgi:hypothetical protein
MHQKYKANESTSRHNPKKKKNGEPNTESCIIVIIIIIIMGAKFRQTERFKNIKKNIRSQYSQFLLKKKSPNNERRKKNWKKKSLSIGSSGMKMDG